MGSVHPPPLNKTLNVYFNGNAFTTIKCSTSASVQVQLTVAPEGQKIADMDNNWLLCYDQDKNNACDSCSYDPTIDPIVYEPTECTTPMNVNKLIITPEYCETADRILLFT